MSERFVRRWLGDAYAAHYLRFTAPVCPEPGAWAERFALRGGETVVDVGCGEGKVLAALSGRLARGVGIDVSPPMLRAAARYAAQHGARNVELLRADLRRLPLRAGSADAALSQAALHHVPDAGKRDALGELARVLRPGALLHLADDAFNLAPEELPARVPEIHAEQERRFGAEGWRDLRTHLAGEDFEHTPFTADLLALLEEAGFGLLELARDGLDGVELLARRSA